MDSNDKKIVTQNETGEPAAMEHSFAVFMDVVERYDVVKDVARLETFCLAGVAHIGFAIVLTNDSGYWSTGSKIDPFDAAFRIADGRVLTGSCEWASSGAATSAPRSSGCSRRTPT